MLQKILKSIYHTITGTRKFYYKKLFEKAASIKNKHILEIGSGRPDNGKYPYSARYLFDDSNEFVCTDLDPSFGHEVLDITKMEIDEEYDVILCLNVLEHVYEVEAAIQNIYNALKTGGVAFIAVPVFFPLHDEPYDFWRFTEHALRKLLDNFNEIKIYHKGMRRYPFGYFIQVSK